MHFPLYSGIDPAALQTTNLFAFYPTAAISATTGLPEPVCALLKGYLYYITGVYGGPAFQEFALGGPLLSPNAGGFIAKKNIHDWLYGEVVNDMLMVCESRPPLKMLPADGAASLPPPYCSS